MRGGMSVEPIGAGWSAYPGTWGLDPFTSGGGRVRAFFEGNFRAIFGNEQVAQGVRDVVGGATGGSTVVGVHPGLDPGLVPEYGAPPQGPRIPGDWDANAWRPRYGRSLAAEPTYGDFPADRTGNPALVRDGLAQIGRGMLAGARSGALFGGVLSLIVNGFQVLRGRQTARGAAGTVVADTAGGAVSGALGALASGLALAAATAAGLIGLPLTLLGVAAGLGGAILGSWVFKRTGLHGGIRNGVVRLLGGSAIGGEVPVGHPGGRMLGMPGSIGGMVPVSPNLGRLVPLHPDRPGW